MNKIGPIVLNPALVSICVNYLASRDGELKNQEGPYKSTYRFILKQSATAYWNARLVNALLLNVYNFIYKSGSLRYDISQVAVTGMTDLSPGSVSYLDPVQNKVSNNRITGTRLSIVQLASHFVLLY